MPTRSLVVTDVDRRKNTGRNISSASRILLSKTKKVKIQKKVFPLKDTALLLKTPQVKQAKNLIIYDKTENKLRVAQTPAPVLKAHKQEKTSTLSQAQKKISRSEPLGHLLVEKLLKEHGFQGGVSSDKKVLDRYSNDESIFTIRPQIVLQPKTKRDIEVAVSVLGKETLRFPSLSLTPRAAGTGLGGGSLTDSIMIDVCTHLHHTEEPKMKNGEIIITCEPGAMWRDVEKKLKACGAYLPSYPASKDICSIGGAVANNAAGPDSLRHGHTSAWVESLDVVLHDGKTYTLQPISYSEYKSLSSKDNAYGRILKEVFTLIERNEKTIYDAKPKTSKNSAGYALWDVMSSSVSAFKKGKATLNLARLVCGSQGTIGIITSVTLRTAPIPKHTELIVIPVFDLVDAGTAILKALDFDPLNIELFDGLTFDLALKNPSFFKDRLGKFEYYQVLLSMYTTFHVRYGRKTPEFTLLITLDKKRGNAAEHLVSLLKNIGLKKARLIKSSVDTEMYWQIRRASYSLSKFQDPKKRPAAFLEDMVVPPKNMPKFFMEIKRLLKKYNLTACVHGHGGNGHLHFYPLIDFENKTTPQLIMKMTEEFFATAIKFDGGLCGEHNDGIIRTPHLSKMFSKEALELFKQLEHIFDPEDIFNPGKKVNPRFDIKSSIRHTNNNPYFREGKEVSGPL